MNGRQVVASLAIALALLAAAPGSGAAPALSGITVGRMKVTIMPEYDTQQALVILEGKFADKGRFPAEVRFNLPAGVTKLTDACSLSPEGHHFCQLFEIKSQGAGKVVDIKLPFSDFFIDYQYSPFIVAPGVERKFVHQVAPVYDIATLEIHVQKPLRITEFSVSPGWTAKYEKDGFEYYKYVYEGVKAGQAKDISVAYSKGDTAPSVERRFSAMATPQMFSGRAGEMLLVVGALGLMAVWFLRRKAGGGAR
jgi:hypothetical protein